jgi:hypothetical protein
MSAAFSTIIMVGALVSPATISGITDAPATRKWISSSPRTDSRRFTLFLRAVRPQSPKMRVTAPSAEKHSLPPAFRQ